MFQLVQKAAHQKMSGFFYSDMDSFVHSVLQI